MPDGLSCVWRQRRHYLTSASKCLGLRVMSSRSLVTGRLLRLPNGRVGVRVRCRPPAVGSRAAIRWRLGTLKFSGVVRLQRQTTIVAPRSIPGRAKASVTLAFPASSRRSTSSCPPASCSQFVVGTSRSQSSSATVRVVMTNLRQGARRISSPAGGAAFCNDRNAGLDLNQPLERVLSVGRRLPLTMRDSTCPTRRFEPDGFDDPRAVGYDAVGHPWVADRGTLLDELNGFTAFDGTFSAFAHHGRRLLLPRRPSPTPHSESGLRWPADPAIPRVGPVIEACMRSMDARRALTLIHSPTMGAILASQECAS